jgi:hypothetical protein
MTTDWLLQTIKRLSLAVFLAATLGSVAAVQAGAQERDWQPQRTWVFIVGTLQWQHSDMFDSFPQKNRRDAQLANFFKTQGVPAGQMVYLKDQQATTRQVRTAFRDLLSRASEGDLLFVYYTGHGYKSDDQRTTFFATYDAGDDVPGWATSSITRDIERYFKGSEVFLTADCCYSGSLTQQVRQLHSRISYACLASSSSNELSTANWTFTEMLLAGLKGKAYADLNQDGAITLQELAEDIRGDMAFAEDQKSSFAATGIFSNQTILATAERRSSRDVSRRVEVKSEGDWYKARIIDAGHGQYRVHYYGYDDWFDEWVNARQVREAKVAHSAASTVNGSARNPPWPGSPRWN